MHRLALALLLALHSPALASNEGFKVVGPLTTHFQEWLNKNGYAPEDFVRADHMVTQGSYGGRTADDQQVLKTPVIFIHGNSDAALRQNFDRNAYLGWENTIDYFLKQDYTSAELYATSWGDTNQDNKLSRTHDCATTRRLRRFLEAVIAYTGADKVSIVTHSMGVTLGRKIIKGGKIQANDGSCDLGVPIRVVDVFVGLAGANYGLCNCEGVEDGLWPGNSCGMNYLDCGLTVLPFPCSGPTYSRFLSDMNNDYQQEAKRVVSVWSDGDELIMYGTMVWGRSTCLIPRSTDKKMLTLLAKPGYATFPRKTYLTHTHMETKELTYVDQYNWVNRID